MSIKIVSDSSANISSLAKVEFSAVPLIISTDEKEYVDNIHLDVHEMIEDLLKYKGKSRTACPGVGEWINAFGDAKEVIGVALTSKLSGCYNSARAAADMYMEDHPDRKVFIIDSLSAGPEMELLVYKIEEYAETGMSFEEICEKISEYTKKTKLAFSLETLNNFARNGRVNLAVAKLAGMLNIRMVGQASNEGNLELEKKCRGEVSAIKELFEMMCEKGYKGGKIIISHTENEKAAEKLKTKIQEKFENVKVIINQNKGLCAYYAERGGLLVGYEIV